MKQTAVDWFQDQIIKIVNGTCELSEIQIFEQAKALEREQIIDAHIDGFYSPPFGKSRNGEANDYYNKTFKTE
jgi:hypothetical protein